MKIICSPIHEAQFCNEPEDIWGE